MLSTPWTIPFFLFNREGRLVPTSVLGARAPASDEQGITPHAPAQDHGGVPEDALLDLVHRSLRGEHVTQHLVRTTRESKERHFHVIAFM